jgi:phage terminase large subunit-like protein
MARPNSQLYSAAQSRDQAAILFDLAAKMVRLSPSLVEYVGVRDYQKQLYCPALGTVYKALSADAANNFGLSPVFVVHDELGQVRGPRSALYDALETATGAQESPLSIVISTQAATDNDLLSILIDDALTGADPRVVLSLYTSPPELDAFALETIKLANPAFGVLQNEAEVLAMAADAKRMPSREAEYRNLVLNQRIDVRIYFIPPAAWKACKAPYDARLQGDVFGGLDLSEVQDLTALVLVGLEPDGYVHVKPTFWLPEHGLIDKAQRDRVPYDMWKEQGHLLTVPGRTIEYEYVAQHMRDLFDEHGDRIKRIGFDRYNWRHFEPWLRKTGFTDEELQKFAQVGMGTASMSPALRTLESWVINRKLKHESNPVLNMCVSNAVVSSKDASCRRLDKYRSNGRIDGAVALAIAAAVAGEEKPQQEQSAGIRVL